MLFVNLNHNHTGIRFVVLIPLNGYFALKVFFTLRIIGRSEADNMTFNCY